MYSISNDRLYRDGEAAPFVPSPNHGGRMLPTLIVLHDTAGRLTKGNSVSWFADPKARVSAHFVVERDGSITQMVECDRQAWHAGKSSWKGRSGCNAFAVGIEIVNPGKLTPAGTAWFGQTFEGFEECATKAHGSGCWLPYTQAQIEAVQGLCAALVEAYPIKEIVTHWMISPGRKVDTNPLFPLEELRRHVFARPGIVSDWPLQAGCSGDRVRLIQSRLKELRYGMVGIVDGIYGPQTRAAVLAWEMENSTSTDGKIDRDEFDAIMAITAKPMAVGEASEKEEAERKAAADNIERAAAAGTVGTGALIIGDAAASPTDKPFWDLLMHMLGQAGEAATKVSVLGIKIAPRVAIAALVMLVCAAVWRWAFTAKGKKS